ncbi:cytochrome c-type biogenesis protein [Comamonas sp. SCN 65-56]|uniref:cytochrome c-type biogenesis protein n=1 Tax=Comamonas sp. SCN 65-56 TaxID=1660095 RepID=UPI000A65E9B3|nr:cytochrome c-type biogenesis protein [Comamonas sp. SCN 65-56]
MRKYLALIALCCACLTAQHALATEAPTLANDPALEQHVLEIAQELRCLVCQNETIAASHADLAVDLRQQIRTKLQEGETPAQIRTFMVDRYGEFVLYKPRLSTKTLLLWIGPFVLLVLGFIVLWRTLRQRATEADTPLSEHDVQRARALLGITREKGE